MNDDKSFLGKGWAFPLKFYAGITPTKMVSAEEDIKESLFIIFSTHIGERLMRPEFGSELHNLIYHNMDLTARTELKAAIEKAVLYFEPRIILDGVSFDVTKERDGVLFITLEYTVKMTNTRSNMVYPYYYEEHF